MLCGHVKENQERICVKLHLEFWHSSQRSTMTRKNAWMIIEGIWMMNDNVDDDNNYFDITMILIMIMLIYIYTIVFTFEFPLKMGKTISFHSEA